MAYATVISIETSAAEEIWFATNEVARQRELVADIFADPAFKAAESDDLRHRFDPAKALAIKVEASTNFVTTADGRLLTDVPESICVNLLAFQGELNAAIAAGQKLVAAYCSVE